MRLVCKTVVLSAMLFGAHLLRADWNPEMLWKDRDPSLLASEDIVALKKRVCEGLQNSWCSKEKIHLLMDLVLMEKPRLCVEIGAFTGSSVLPVASSLHHLRRGKIYAIDAWSNVIAVRNMEADDPNKTWWATVNMYSVQEAFSLLMSAFAVRDFVQPIPLPSEEAIDFINQEIDFLHLDGDYSEEGALLDVELYVPKVKKGGYILLSNIFTMVNKKPPKLKAFHVLAESCEIVADIENENAVLFRKN